MAFLPNRYPVLLTVALLTGLAMPSLLWADSPQGKRYALLVGIKDYDHSKLKPLDFTENDVTDLGQLLRASGYEIKLLTGSKGKDNPDCQPTRSNILAQLKTMLDKCNRHDTVLVALAGHGLQFDQQKDSYFCPSDANPTKPQSLVSLGNVYQQLDDSGAGVKLVLVDACRDDPMQGRGRGIDGDNAPRPPRGVAVFFSCSAGQRAFEHNRLKHGVFFHYVLEGLKGAARNEDNEVDWSRLTGYVSKKVSREVPKLMGNGAKQAPNLVADLSGEPPVLLRLKDFSPVQRAKVFELAGRTGKGEWVSKTGTTHFTYEFQPSGKVIYRSSRETLEGSWAQSGNRVTVQTSGSHEVGTIDENRLVLQCDFQGRDIGVATVIFPDEQTIKSRAKTFDLAGRMGKGKWVIRGITKYFTYEFKSGGTVIYRGETEAALGTWTQNGNNVTILVGKSSEVGTIEGNRLLLQVDNGNGPSVAEVTFEN